MTDTSHSRFDFGVLAGSYDRWYETDVGKMYDHEEKSLVQRTLPRAQAGNRLLDVGCGTGHWSRFFASLGFDVVGVDISPEMVDAARLHGSTGCHFETADACRLPFDSASFDVIAAIATLEFIADPEAALSELFRCVKPAGSVVIGTLNKCAPLNRQRVADGKQPYASARLFSPSEIRELLSPYGRVRMFVSDRALDSKAVKGSGAVRDRLQVRPRNRGGAFIVAEVRL